jgi:GLPGLI family protein
MYQTNSLYKVLYALAIYFITGLSCVYAQEGEPVMVSVTYQFKHINDLNKPNTPFEEETILRLGKSSSKYSSWTEEMRYKSPPKIVNNSPASDGSGKSASYGFKPTVMVSSNGVSDFELFQYPNTETLRRIVSIGNNNYEVESTLTKIDWKLSKDKKQIGNYTCQKAIGNYGGRVYTAWYAPTLPFRNGPWKLWGLPGLILEATDSTGEVAFLFKEISKPSEAEFTGPRKKRLIKTGENSLERAIKAFDINPTAVYQSQLPATITQTAEIAFIGKDGTLYMGEDGQKSYDRYKKELKKRKNNPLELKKVTK